MKGSWEGIAGCVVHVDVHGECACCGWMQCSCYLAQHTAKTYGLLQLHFSLSEYATVTKECYQIGFLVEELFQFHN